MSRASSRRAVVAIAIGLIFAGTFSLPAVAQAVSAPVEAGSAGGGPAAVMLDTADLPAGFRTDELLTGPLTSQRARELGRNPSQAEPQGGWVRTWLKSPATEVIEIAINAGTHHGAEAGVAETAAGLIKQGNAVEPVSGFVNMRAYRASVMVNRNPFSRLLLPFARGPYAFMLQITVPELSASSASSLMSRLAAAQVRKVPADTPDTIPSGFAAPEMSGGVVGGLIGYLLVADGIGYFRNPLRRRLFRSRRAAPLLPDRGVADVSAAAKRNRRIAACRLAVQLAGLGVAAFGADYSEVRYWYAYLVTGFVIVWGGGRFIHPAGARRARNQTVIAGSRRVIVVGMLVLASATVLLGLITITSGAMYRTYPPGALAPSSLGLGTTTAQYLSNDLLGTGIGLLVFGAISTRVARRLGSIDARRLMVRDPRPPLLYLRAFGDDRLRLWTATLGRPSLIERFTLRRSDRFEEVLVRHLSQYGPVIAVNPPGTRLAPLGAARETIDSADWQSAVAARMARSSLIVFLAPPSQVTPGLQWELQTVSEYGYWDKALVVVPPVHAKQLQARWQVLRGRCEGVWPFTVGGPVDDPSVLTLTFWASQWSVTAAYRRTEWSYAAAIRHVLGEPYWPPSAPARDPRPRVRRKPLTSRL